MVGPAAAVRAQESPSGGFSLAGAAPVLVEQFEGVVGKAARAANGDVLVVVKLKDASLADYEGGVSGLAPTSPSATGQAELDVASAESANYLAYLNGKIDGFVGRAERAAPAAVVTTRFDIVIGGVAMQVPESQLAALAADPAVAAVLPDTLEQVQTDVTPGFIGAPTIWNRLGGQASAGEGVVVGVIDTGIWPDHPSVSDPDPDGKPYAAPPAPPSGTRACELGPETCNNKLIGADRFMATYDAQIGADPGGYADARDSEGHGTHTATTAAGNGHVDAEIFGVPRGEVSGIAPRAHVMVYKVCGLEGCYSSDSAAAIQESIRDGVDVINFSISGGSNPYGDPVSLAFLDAYNAGIFVAASAGNAGPGADTTDHREPWVTTVAASTSNRSFVGSTTLTGGPAPLTVAGVTVSEPLTTPAPVVDSAAAPYNDPQCTNSTADGAFAGRVVLCTRGGNGRVEKGYNVLQRGAVGMILINPVVQDVETDNHWLPAIHLTNDVGAQVRAYVTANPGAMATIASGTASPDQGDVMAAFSSRGGPGQSLGVSKPDVTAPGVQILAGHTPTPNDVAAGPPGELFQAIAGTSMSSPHVAGAGALLAALHPTWTPGQIKSALMITAETRVVKEDGTTPTTPFDDGSGRIDLTDAGNPGFTIDATGAEYVANAAALYNSNYPSLYVPALAGGLTVQRTLKSVESRSRTYFTSVQSSPGLKVKVPGKIVLGAGASKTIEITVDAKDVPLGQTRHATITFRDAHYGRKLVFPITIVRRQGPLTIDKTCAPNPVVKGSNTTCTITMSNTSSEDATVSMIDQLPSSKLRLVPGSTSGGTERGNTVLFNGTIPGQLDPEIAIGPGATPAGGYLSLRSLGSAPIGGFTDETIGNFNVPAFTLAGVTYDRIGVVSNGYLVLGGGTTEDVQFENTNLPDPAVPNNILAPFWTDLNPAFGGAIFADLIQDGDGNQWIVVEWEAVREYSQPRTATFQIWIGVAGDASPVEDISFAYGTIQGNGDGGLLTVGAENPNGTSGGTTYYNGAGTLPTPATELAVTGTPGETFSHTVTFQARAVDTGTYVNYARATADTFQGTAIARFEGRVTRR
jgi:subtilisin family serine protease